jgi:hypothetical protein
LPLRRRSFDPPRELRPEEAAVVRLLAGRADDGTLGRQLPSLRVAEEDGEGEILDLVILPPVEPSPVRRTVVSAWGRDVDGEAVEVLLHVIDGYVAELEFVRYAPGPLVAPPAAGSLTESWEDLG